jgi:adenylate cyclase, class 2
VATEVEMKAWIDDPEALRRHLQNSCREIRSFYKADTYFVAPVRPAGSPGLPPQEFRIRNDDGKLICTFKEKEIVDGMETNREVEFTVSDEAAFSELAERIGCRVFVRKEKRGTQYSCGGLSVELSEVAGLGTFLEVEKVVEDDDSEAIARAQSGIRAFFTDLGITREKIEPRPYNDILLERGVFPG